MLEWSLGVAYLLPRRCMHDLLTTNPYVIVIAIDFSKAFDSVRHKTLLEKVGQLDIPSYVYNWLVDFFAGHSHQT